MTQNLHEVFPSYFSQSKHPTLWRVPFAKVKDEKKRHDLIEVAIATRGANAEKLSLAQINERVKASKEVTAPKHPLKERYKKALPRLQKSKVWENPKKQKTLEKLLAQIEALIDE